MSASLRMAGAELTVKARQSRIHQERKAKPRELVCRVPSNFGDVFLQGLEGRGLKVQAGQLPLEAGEGQPHLHPCPCLPTALPCVCFSVSLTGTLML